MLQRDETPRIRAERVSERLQGTCCEALTDEELDDQDMLVELDDLTQLCGACEWWCETNELDDDGICEDCKDD
ncbi:MAG: hypothetical protein V3S55_15240 [Nitrospiraceae bacterium]